LDKKKIIAFDFDGVISPLPGYFTGFTHQRWFIYLNQIFIPLRRFLRRIRGVNPEIRHFISYLKRNGRLVYIVTANPPETRSEIEYWLKKRGTHYDRILYRCLKCSHRIDEWKARLAERLKIDYFLDDDPCNIAEIDKINFVRTVLYTGQKFDQLSAIVEL